MNVSGMVTTRPSHAYTACALASFFQTTPFGADDRFVLIDNDGTYGPPPDAWPQVTYLANPVPYGFAANVNQVLRLARACGADLFFLNNDLIFTPGWFAPLGSLSPRCCRRCRTFSLPGAWAIGGAARSWIWPIIRAMRSTCERWCAPTRHGTPVTVQS